MKLYIVKWYVESTGISYESWVIAPYAQEAQLLVSKNRPGLLIDSVSEMDMTIPRNLFSKEISK